MTQTLSPTHGGPQPIVTVPPPGRQTEANLLNVPQVPSVSSSLLAVGGLALFGACTALGAPGFTAATHAALVPVAGLVGAMVLTGPALVAGHLFLRPNIATEVPVAALGLGLGAAGSVAAGIAPLALFLVATTGLWLSVLSLGFALTGLACAAVTLQALAHATGERPGFVFVWVFLAALVSIRLTIAVGSAALEVAP
ncbi:MAG: hypothetical protein JKY37_20870 [Nannocystaceae bacterium]|nr:hypothetical protein [Nannocystaceae bacterium]